MTKPVHARTVKDYHSHLRTFFRWIVAEGGLESSPMERIPVPTARADQVQPFTPEQVNALLAAAKHSRHPRRNEAVLLFLLDTGVRASELCVLRLEDVDIAGRRATVLGKGNKRRMVSFQKTTARALWNYLREEEREPNDPLFLSERGEQLTRSGLLQLIERLGSTAGIATARCSPHTFRHTFAVEFLRAGGNVFTLQQMLGHTALHMTNRYVTLAQADIENQHRQYSPVERLKGRRR
jgi:site-specific recombinase XerD